MLLVEAPVLLHQAPHQVRAHAGRAGGTLAARGRAPVVGEHLGNAARPPAARGRAEPEVPILAALDEARVVAAHVGPHLATVERADVDRAPREQLLEREAAGAPDAVVVADEPHPGVNDPDVALGIEHGTVRARNAGAR